MRIFSSRLLSYQTMLCVVSVLLVAAFQGYWLYDTYQLRKANFRRGIAEAAEQQFQILAINKISGAISLNRADSGSIPLSSILGSERLSDIGGNDSALLGSVKGQDVASVSLDVANLKSISDERGYDSLLYLGLKESVPDLRRGAFLVQYRHPGRDPLVFPRGASCTGSAADAVEVSSPGNFTTSFAICVDRLPALLLGKMWGAFLFSGLYLALSTAAILLLFRAARQRRRLQESKASFTQNMTHELKIPISTLYLATESLEGLIGDKASTDAAQRYTGILRASLDRLSGLVDKILHNARLDHPGAQLQRSPVRIRSVLESALDHMRLYLGRHGAAVYVTAVDAEASVCADPAALESVFVNLVENAVKYNANPPRLHVSLHTDKGVHVVRFSDNGQGIPRRYQEEVFQPYFRVPEADLHTVKGFGLGLSQVRHIVRLHRGTVRVAASGPEGTDIEIKLPACHA